MDRAARMLESVAVRIGSAIAWLGIPLMILVLLPLCALIPKGPKFSD